MMDEMIDSGRIALVVDDDGGPVKNIEDVLAVGSDIIVLDERA